MLQVAAWVNLCSTMFLMFSLTIGYMKASPRPKLAMRVTAAGLSVSALLSLLVLFG